MLSRPPPLRTKGRRLGSGKKGQHGNEQEVVIAPQSYFEIKRIIRDAEVNGKTHKLFVELDQIR